MDFNVCRNMLPRCCKVVINITRPFKGSVLQFQRSGTVARSTLTQKTCYKWRLLESQSIVQFGKPYSIWRISDPHATNQQILHTSPMISSVQDKLLQSTRSIHSSDQIKAGKTNAQKENVGADSVTGQKSEEVAGEEHVDEKPQGLMQRFRQTYKEYGKVLVGVHIFTSCIWATSFYYAAVSGIDVVPFLKWLGLSDKMIAPFAVPGVGHAAVAYLLYKLATPLRYTVTIGGTRVAVNVLRRWGYLPPIPEKNRIRSLMKEGQQKMKERYGDIRKSNHEH